MRMRPDIQAAPGQKIAWPQMVEEAKRPQVFTRESRQRARHREAVDLPRVPAQQRFEAGCRLEDLVGLAASVAGVWTR